MHIFVVLITLINGIFLNGLRNNRFIMNQDSETADSVYYSLYGNVVAKEIPSEKEGLEKRLVDFTREYFSPQLTSNNCHFVEPLHTVNLSRTALYLGYESGPLRFKIYWINSKGQQVFQMKYISKGVLNSFTFYSTCDTQLYSNDVTLLHRDGKFYLYSLNSEFNDINKADPYSLKILTLNVWNTNSRNKTGDGYVGRLEMMIDEIERSGAEVIGLQEVRFDDNQQIGSLSPNQMQHLSLRLPRYNFIYQPASLYAEDDVINSTKEEGLAIMSRYPIISWSYILLSGDIDLDVHQRICLHAEIKTPRESVLHVFVTHLSLNNELREMSVQEIVDFMSRYEGDKVLMGDMNCEPDSREMEYLREDGLKDAWLAFYPEPDIRPPRRSEGGVERFHGLTFDATDKELRKRIDFIYLTTSPSSAASAIELIGSDKRNVISDHLGVLLTLNSGINKRRNREDL